MLEAVVNQRRQLGGRLDHDVAAATAVSAIGAALGDVGLTAKRHAAGSAVATFDVDATDIGKLRHCAPFRSGGIARGHMNSPRVSSS